MSSIRDKVPLILYDACCQVLHYGSGERSRTIALVAFVLTRRARACNGYLQPDFWWKVVEEPWRDTNNIGNMCIKCESYQWNVLHDHLGMWPYNPRLGVMLRFRSSSAQCRYDLEIKKIRWFSSFYLPLFWAIDLFTFLHYIKVFSIYKLHFNLYANCFSFLFVSSDHSSSIFGDIMLHLFFSLFLFRNPFDLSHFDRFFIVIFSSHVQFFPYTISFLSLTVVASYSLPFNNGQLRKRICKHYRHT